MTVSHVRYGVELEGPFRGLSTLVLLSVRHHDVALVRRVLAEHMRTPEHVWAQAAHQRERLDWDRLAAIRDAGFRLTVQVRRPGDLPPSRGHAEGVGLVWRMPDRWRDVAAACSHGTVFMGGGPFDGRETELRFRVFDAALYEEDEIWPV